MFHIRTDYNSRIQDSENLIPDDEPVFLIRAQSPGAGDSLRHFAATVEDKHCDPVIVAAIREHADRMDAWKTKKVPDAPNGVVILVGNPKSPGSVEPFTQKIIKTKSFGDKVKSSVPRKKKDMFG